MTIETGQEAELQILALNIQLNQTRRILVLFWSSCENSEIGK